MKTITGTVTSSKMDKTSIVSVHTYKSHPKYKKRYRTTKKFYAHDENNFCREGDTVTISEHRPLSKTKRWRVISINGTPIEKVTHESIVREIPETDIEEAEETTETSEGPTPDKTIDSPQTRSSDSLLPRRDPAAQSERERGPSKQSAGRGVPGESDSEKGGGPEETTETPEVEEPTPEESQ